MALSVISVTQSLKIGLCRRGSSVPELHKDLCDILEGAFITLHIIL
jgi:hypothetical protein